MAQKQELQHTRFDAVCCLSKEMLEDGENLPFAVLVERGGYIPPVGSVPCAKNYLVAAVEFGPEWDRVKPMAKAAKLLHFDKQCA